MFCDKENALALKVVFLDNPILFLFLSSHPCLWTDGCVCDAGWMSLNCSQGKGKGGSAVTFSNNQIKLWLAVYCEIIT